MPKLKQKRQKGKTPTASISKRQANIHENRKKEEGSKGVESMGDDAIPSTSYAAAVQELDLEKCSICKQLLDQVEMYKGHPDNAFEEVIAVEKLNLMLTESDKPDLAIKEYAIFDEKGHLCPIDTGLIEKKVSLFISGYISSTYDSVYEETFQIKNAGPIENWYIYGQDDGLSCCITICTSAAEYRLMKPSVEYCEIMNNVYEKLWLTKAVVEYLQEYHYLLPTYAEMLEIICESTIPNLDNKLITEEILHKHAQYVCDQVVNLGAFSERENILVTLPCMRELIRLMGIKIGNFETNFKMYLNNSCSTQNLSKATTTPLVRRTFELFFTKQLDKINTEAIGKNKRCAVCVVCQRPDCGECAACRTMAKFGGKGKSNKTCDRRKCPNMAIQNAEQSDPEDEEEYTRLAENGANHEYKDLEPVQFTRSKRKVKWIGTPTKADASKIYYGKVELNDICLENGDFVVLSTIKANIPALIVRIAYMWKESVNSKHGYFHGEMFIRSCHTVLGEVGDPREIYLSDRCCHGISFSSVIRKANVTKIPTPPDWFKNGGKEVNYEVSEEDGVNYFYQKYYDKFTCRFEDLPQGPPCPNPYRSHRYCPSCQRKTDKEFSYIPKVVDKVDTDTDVIPEKNRSQWSYVEWNNHNYKPGSGVFLRPNTFKLESSMKFSDSKKKKKLPKVDETIYPEHYRKNLNSARGSNLDTYQPFCVGYILAVFAVGNDFLMLPQNIRLKVHILYRPENTTLRFPQHEDLNMVYWSEEVLDIPFSVVTGPCELVCENNVSDLEHFHQWLNQDTSRFYFKEAYDKDKDSFCKVPDHAINIGLELYESSKAIPKVRSLNTLDVFAGCGGLSEGLHNSGVSKCKWAVENMEAAAFAYSINQNCSVMVEDCNTLLREAIAGTSHTKRGGIKIPQKGEVELLCGGPPCQGFSGMNRFNSRDYSNFKNSLVATMLSYCDYYRPKYFIFENVRNFVAFKKGMVLKLTIRALLDMGYQCTFGVLQAGSYGVPQTRKRLIILASAPGYKLPLFPEPTNVFNKRACSLNVLVDGKRFCTNIKWDKSAPRRTCTIQDAMSDLPVLAPGEDFIEMPYTLNAQSHYQRLLRNKLESELLRDHICKKMSPIVQARISKIPLTPGSDWRDLPNISMTLSDGSNCKVLQYRHDDIKNGKSSKKALRGVCACASGKSCNPSDKQDNTLIPWCLPHTGNRHNHWAGLYGRLSWEGYFSTTVTDPEPMGKQGRVLHPEQDRVVSVRECARSQGFPDSYRFAGSVLDKYRQIGNAVPPPLAFALGREIKKALIQSQINEDNELNI